MTLTFAKTEELFVIAQDGTKGYYLPFLCQCGKRLAVSKHGETWCPNGDCNKDVVGRFVESFICPICEAEFNADAKGALVVIGTGDCEGMNVVRCQKCLEREHDHQRKEQIHDSNIHRT